MAALDDVVTKSGTGAFHGSVHKYFRNDTLDANDFFLNSSGSTKIELSPNNFGATFTNHEALRRWKDERVLSIGPGLSTKQGAWRTPVANSKNYSYESNRSLPLGSGSVHITAQNP